MTDNVIELKMITKMDLPPDRILEAAKGRLETCIIIGYNKDGSEYFASTKADAGEVIYHLERAKYKLLKICDE